MAASEPDKPLNGFTVMIVEDEADLREIFSDQLTGRGAKVVEASSGSEAQSILQTIKPHIIVSDIRMPDGDGISLLKFIREKGEYRGKFIFLTGHASPHSAELIALKPDRILNKPINLRYLCEFVEKALRDEDGAVPTKI